MSERNRLSESSFVRGLAPNGVGSPQGQSSSRAAFDGDTQRCLDVECGDKSPDARGATSSIPLLAMSA
jgi:hypothetical protein